MTPKEKAKELAIKFINSTDVVKPNLASIEKALLCVNELYADNKKQNDFVGMTYWDEVGIELKRM